MKFCWTTLHVKDLEKSLDFYTKIIGLRVNRRTKVSPVMEIAFLGSQETQVELICDGKVQKPNYGEDISMGFQVESLDKISTVLSEKGIPLDSGPFQPNPTIRFLYVLDPDGMKIQFVEFLT